MYRYTLPVLALALLGCPKEDASPPPETPASTTSSRGPVIPDTADSKKFAARLVDLEITDWSPEDTGQVDFEYQTFDFRNDNTWYGEARVTVIDESVDCKESGTWTMDPAESPTTSYLTWTVEKTSCPGREAGKEMRVKMTINDDDTFKLYVH